MEIESTQPKKVYFSGLDEAEKKSFERYDEFFRTLLTKLKEKENADAISNRAYDQNSSQTSSQYNNSQDKKEKSDYKKSCLENELKIIPLTFTYKFFSEISNEWISFLMKEDLLFDLCEKLVLAYSQEKKIRPRMNEVLRWMQISNNPESVKYIIFGMQPLKSDNNFESNGAAFSVNRKGEALLRRDVPSVFRVLKVLMLVSIKTLGWAEFTDDENLDDCIEYIFGQGFDPTHMAQNGFLFYNAFPTVPSDGDNHSFIWEGFALKFLKKLGRGRKLPFLAFYHPFEILKVFLVKDGEQNETDIDENFELYRPDEITSSNKKFTQTNHVSYWVDNNERNDVRTMVEAICKNPALAHDITTHFFLSKVKLEYLFRCFPSFMSKLYADRLRNSDLEERTYEFNTMLTTVKKVIKDCCGDIFGVLTDKENEEMKKSIITLFNDEDGTETV